MIFSIIISRPAYLGGAPPRICGSSGGGSGAVSPVPLEISPLRNSFFSSALRAFSHAEASTKLSADSTGQRNRHSARASSAALRWAIRSAISSRVSVHRDNGLVLLEQRPQPSNYGPLRGLGAVACLPTAGTRNRQTKRLGNQNPRQGYYYRTIPVPVLLLRANELCFGPRRRAATRLNG
jgi:hypothetical protein